MTTHTAPPSAPAKPAQEQLSHTVVRRAFHAVAITEAITWAGLLYAMVLRAITGDASLIGPWGMAHGIAFMAFAMVVTIAWLRFRWKFWQWAIALLMAIPPLMTIPLEIWYSRTGKLKITQ